MERTRRCEKADEMKAASKTQGSDEPGAEPPAISAIKAGRNSKAKSIITEKFNPEPVAATEEVRGKLQEQQEKVRLINEEQEGLGEWRKEEENGGGITEETRKKVAEWLKTMQGPDGIEEIRRAILHTRRGAGAGADGWGGLALFEAARVDTEMTATIMLHLLTDLMEENPDPKWLATILAVSMMAMSKPTGGIRPIAITSIWVRVAVRMVVRQEKTNLRGVMEGSNQWGLTGCGVAIAHVVWTLAVLDKEGIPSACVQVDYSNAFNTPKPPSFAEGLSEESLQKAAPLTATMSTNTCAKAGAFLFSVRGSEGGTIQHHDCGAFQGLPDVPVAFSAVQRKARDEARGARLNQFRRPRVLTEWRHDSKPDDTAAMLTERDAKNPPRYRTRVTTMAAEPSRPIWVMCEPRVEVTGEFGMQQEASENMIRGYLTSERQRELWHLMLAMRGATTGVPGTRAEYDAPPKEWTAAVKTLATTTLQKIAIAAGRQKEKGEGTEEIVRALVNDTHYVDDGTYHGIPIPAIEGMMRNVLTNYRRNLRLNPAKCNVVAPAEYHTEINAIMEPIRRADHKLGSKEVDWAVTDVGVQLGIPYAAGASEKLWAKVKEAIKEKVVDPIGRVIQEMLDYPGHDTKQAALWAARRWAFSCLTYIQQAWGLRAPEQVWADAEDQVQALLAVLTPRAKALGTENDEDVRRLAWAERNKRLNKESGVWQIAGLGNGPHAEVLFPGKKGGWRYPTPKEEAPYLAAAIWPTGIASALMPKEEFDRYYVTHRGGEVVARKWVDRLVEAEELAYTDADAYNKRRIEMRRMRGAAHALKNTEPSYPLHRITDAQFDLTMVLLYGDLRRDEPLRKLIDRDSGVLAFRGGLVEECFRRGLKWYFPLTRVATQPKPDRSAAATGPGARRRMDTVAVMRDGKRINFDTTISNPLAKSHITKHKTLEAHCEAVDKTKMEHYAGTHQKPQVVFFSLTGGIYDRHCAQLMRFARQCQQACGESANESFKRTKLDWETVEG